MTFFTPSQNSDFMRETEYDYFFDLSNFKYPELFVSSLHVWDVLGDNLKAFIKNNIRPKILGDVSKDAYLVGEEIYIEEGVRVEPTAYIEGPTIILKGSVVRHGAYIRGNVIVGNNCVVGHTSEIKGSVLLNGSKAAHFAYVGDSILGNNVNLGAGTKLANLKVTPSSIKIKVNDRIFDTGARKLGAIIGDDSETGCNSVTAPGTLIGKKSIIYPTLFVRGFVPLNSILKV